MDISRLGRSLGFAVVVGGALLVLLAGPLTACPSTHRGADAWLDLPALLFAAR